MFAMALWDGRKKRLVLARDRLGKKPLFYSWDGSACCSAPRSRPSGRPAGSRQEMDLEALSDYFSYHYVPAPRPFTASVRKLRPAHYLVVDESGIREVPYWDIRFDQTRATLRRRVVRAFLAEYRTAVKSRLVSDVPLGAFLSGGVDSSSVVALMNEFQPPVTTCSIGFTEEDAMTKPGCARVRGEPGREPLRADRRAARDRSGVEAGVALRRALRRFLGGADLLCFASGAAACHGGAFGRRRRRELRGLPAVQVDHGGGAAAVAMLPAAVRRTVFGPLGEMYPKMGWAPRVFRAKSTFQSLARDPRSMDISTESPAARRR